MPASRVEGDIFVNGNVRCQTLSVPDGAVDNAAIAADADIAASKQEHYHAIHYSQADGSDVAATSGDGVPIHTVRGTTATIIGVEVVCPDAPSGGDKAFTVDLHKANSGAAAATVLSSTIAVANGSTDYDVHAGTISSASLADGDTLLAVVAVSGSTGSQGQGLVVTVFIEEDYS